MPGYFRTTRHFLRDTSGSGTIEACLWIPVLLAFFVTSFDATYVFLRDGEIRRVVQEGSRQYIKGLHGTDLAKAEKWIETALDPLAPNANATVKLDSSGELLVTTITYPASDTDLTGWVSALTGLTLTVQTVHQTET